MSIRALSMARPYFRTLLVATTIVLVLSALRCSHAQEQRKVHESPYYLPGLSDIPFNFSGDFSEGSGAFRVLGARTPGLSLSFTHAEASCRALEGGRGLAMVNSAQRRLTLTSALIKSMVRILSPAILDFMHVASLVHAKVIASSNLGKEPLSTDVLDGFLSPPHQGVVVNLVSE
jgi:hypothetical protein